MVSYYIAAVAGVAREQLQSAKHTYNEPGRDVTWTALVISSDLIVYSVWDVTWTLVISSDLCSVWQFHIFYITMHDW